MPSAGKIQLCNSNLRLTTAKAVSVSGREPLRLRASFSIQMQENAMNRYLTIGLAMLAGAALGASAVQGLHAQAKPPA